MYVRRQVIRFDRERRPIPGTIQVGFESDNLVERLAFELPEVSARQTATLMMSGQYADAVQLIKDADGKWTVDLTAALVGAAEVIEGYVRIDGADGEVWNSGVMRLATKDLPEIDQDIEQRFPTAVEQMLTAMNEHSAEMDEAVQRAEDAAAHAEKVKDGGYYQPTVTAAGDLTWTASKDNMPAVAGSNIRGPQGVQGPAGQTGPKGEKGETGAQGPQGIQGPKGEKGDKGDTGATGPQGPKGADGTMSFEDLTEEQKATLKGDKGDTGATGPQGEKGDKGDTGATGPTGPQGEQGPIGLTGPQGERGESGVYIGEDEPSDPEVKVWINPNGEEYNPDGAAVLYTPQELNEDQQEAARENIGAASAEKVSQLYEEFNDFKESGAGIAVDATLTQEGQAADAKAVGEKVKVLSEEIEKLDGSSGWINVPNVKIKSINGYAFAICDSEGKIALAVDEQGKVTYVGQGTKSIKQHGNYDAEINMFICYGQSWSTGYDASAITTTPRYDNLMLNTGIMTDPLSDLSAVATSFIPAIEMTQTSEWKKGETPVTAQMHTVKQLMECEDGLTIADLSYQLLGTAPGMGSKTLAELEKGTDYYNRLIAQVQQAYDIASAMGKRLVVQAFSWVQGSLGRAGNYADALEQLRLDIDTDVKAITGQTQDVKCITWQSFIYNGSMRAKQVYDQYVGAAETYPHIICAGATYHLDNVNAANLHFTSESQDWLGAYFGVAYKRTIIDGEGFKPVQPTKASKSGKILYVKFTVPQRPLVFDTERLTEAPNKGFKLYDADGVEKTITDVAIIAPDMVKIVCAADVASTDRLTYGDITTETYQWVSDNHGNLRDSQGDHIQYVTDAYEYYGSLNGDNTPPYGYIPVPSQVLPLHNWCVIFDKTIAELEG